MRGGYTMFIISWENIYSKETGFVGDIDKKERHFVNTPDKKNAKLFPNKGLATIAVKQLVNFGEAENNDFAIVSV